MADDTLIFDTRLDTSGLSTGLGKIGDVAGAAFKGVAVAVGAATTAVGALAKSALDGYASYEQLTGGVETLFKESSDTIMQYADNAYKTAGMTANQYMETVTSFSASLIQSTGGDTAKAAEYANMAITDMSDNANKMGSNMQDIQNAYQGFAKQNYSMLDNLKLGYGGTQQEMYRLMSDAAKLDETFAATAEFSIDKQGRLTAGYADIVQAINIVQTEMGITGTTAKEASSTIEGSVNSMKAAWGNLVVGIADDNADLGSLIDQFIDSAMTAADNILPRIEQILTGIGTLIETMVPQIMQMLPEIINTVLPQLLESGVSVVNSLIQGIVENLPALLDIALDLVMQLANVIIENLPMIIEAGLQIIVQLALGIAQALPELIPTLVDTVIMIVETLIDNIDMLIDAAIAIIVALAEGLIKSLPRLIEKIPVIVSKLVDAIVTNAPKLLKAGLELIVTLAKALIQYTPQLLAKIPEIIVKLVKGFIDLRSKFNEVGSNIINGIWDGIKGGWNWLVGKVSSLAGDLYNSAKKALGIASPSKKFRYLGEMCVAGMDEPIEDYNPYETMERSFKASAGSLQASFAGRYSGSTLDYSGFGEQVKNALAGMAVTIDGRTAGALLADPINNALGVINGRRV